MASLVLRFSGSHSLTALVSHVCTGTWCDQVEAEVATASGLKLLGVRPRQGVSYRCATATDYDRVERYWMDLPIEGARGITLLLQSQLDKPYDRFGLLRRRRVNEPFYDLRRWYPASLLAWATAEAGYALTEGQANTRLSLQSLLSSSRLKRLS